MTDQHPSYTWGSRMISLEKETCVCWETSDILVPGVLEVIVGLIYLPFPLGDGAISFLKIDVHVKNQQILLLLDLAE